MSSFPSLPESEEEDAKYQNICNTHKHLLETLPKANGWRNRHIYNYNGSWLSPLVLKTNLLLHVYFKSHPTDIFLASFMKSGTTWLKALMFSTLNRHRYTFSNHYLHKHGPQSTFPLLDVESYPITDFTTFSHPRLFATHSARTLLPPCISSGKFVYVCSRSVQVLVEGHPTRFDIRFEGGAGIDHLPTNVTLLDTIQYNLSTTILWFICRDPKDVFISKWIFMSKLRPKDLPPLSLDEAFELFCLGVSEFGPFWEHVLSYWRASLESPEKILFLKYEELKEQPEVVVRKLAAFMGKPLTAEEEGKGVVGEIVNLCSFESLKNLEVNKKGVEKFGKLLVVEKQDFFRKGEIGDWKNYLSEEMKERIDGIMDDKFRGSGLSLRATV